MHLVDESRVLSGTSSGEDQARMGVDGSRCQTEVDGSRRKQVLFLWKLLLLPRKLQHTLLPNSWKSAEAPMNVREDGFR